MAIIPFENHKPSVSDSCFVAPDAWIIGQVVVGASCSIFFNTVIRGDIQPITILEGSNLQEHVLVHSSHGMSPVTIGRNVTIGHRAIIHGCSIGNYALIGMGATILDNAVIGPYSIVGAHTLVPKGMTVPERSLVIGTPGRIIRPITEQEAADLELSAKNYQQLGAYYRDFFPPHTV